MALRLGSRAFGAVRLGPALPTATIRSVTSHLSSSRHNSSVPAEEPKKKAQSIIDSLPGNNLASKAAILSTGAGLSAYAIGSELFVVNEEAIVAFSLLTVFFGIFKYGGPAFNSWAEGQRAKMLGILGQARENHTDSVRQRIDSVKDLSGVVEITKDLFAVSKETAKLEAEAYELEQKTTIAAEAKAVLDSWVRYEGQVKARQQRELSESIISKIEKELENPKVLKQILDQAVQDVERIVSQQKS